MHKHRGCAMLLAFTLLYGCSRMEEAEKENMRKRNMVGERIHRHHDEYLFVVPPLEQRKRERYPWEKEEGSKLSKITKEDFRCRGKTSNTALEKEKHRELIQIKDCSGVLCHSLPIRGGKEFIYLAFLEILNSVQVQAHQKVIVTCGHRCHVHNTYVGGEEQSKHLLGAQVDFYLKGLEWEPERVVNMISAYYEQRQMPLQKKGEYQWENQEVLLRIVKQKEGRDRDNNHKFPYLSLELMWDRELDESITYQWAKGFNGYLRY